MSGVDRRLVARVPTPCAGTCASRRGDIVTRAGARGGRAGRRPSTCSSRSITRASAASRTSSALARRAAELGLRMLASGDFLGGARFGDAPGVAAERVGRWLERAVALGSPILRVTSGLLPRRSGHHARGDRGRAALGRSRRSGPRYPPRASRRDARAREPLRLHCRRVPLDSRGGRRRSRARVPRRDQPGRRARGPVPVVGAARAVRRGGPRKGLRARVDPDRGRLPPPGVLGAVPLPG